MLTCSTFGFFSFSPLVLFMLLPSWFAKALERNGAEMLLVTMIFLAKLSAVKTVWDGVTDDRTAGKHERNRINETTETCLPCTKAVKLR